MNYRHLLPLPLLVATPALAQNAQSTAGLESAKGEVVVTANRDARPVDTVGQAVTVLDTVTIETRQTITVGDLLRQTPGVAVTRNGGPGTVTSVFIRGAESDQTVALIDGVKLNDPSAPGGGVNFGDLLIGNIARIEVLRGAQSVLWGSQAIGGVVNLITRQPTDRLTLNARAEGGWHGTGQGFANISDRVGPLALSLGGGYLTTDGISAFAGGRERDGFHQYAGNGSATLAVADGVSIDLRGFYAKGRTDNDGFAPPTYAFGDTAEYADSEQIVGYGGVNAGLFGGRLRNRLGYARTQSNRVSIDPNGFVRETFRGRGSNDRVEYQGTLDLGAAKATFGAEREVSRYRTASFGGPVTRGRARLFSVYGQLAVTPVAGLTATGGVRHDDHNVFGGETTGSGSIAYSLNGGATVLRGSYSEGFKAPTLYQLQGDYGNRLLRPERSQGYDVGVTQRALDGGIEASATWFHRDTRDQIAFISCATPLTGICAGRPFGTYDNVARTRGQGAEVALTLRPATGFVASAAYTYLDAANRSAGTAFGKRLARRPDHSVTVNADYRWSFGLSTGATVTAVGDSFDDPANARRLDGYALIDLRASLPVTRGVELYGRVENLFDERYQTVFQYGQPGRAAYGGVRLAL